MGILVLKDQIVYNGKYRLDPVLRSVSVAGSVDSKDCTVLGDSTRHSKPGLKDVAFVGEGFVDYGAAGAYEAGLFDTHAVLDSITTLLAEGETAGSVAYSVKGVQTELSENGAVGDLFAVKFKAVASGSDLIRGVLAKSFAKTPITATGAGSALSLGAVGAAQRLYAVLHVDGITGTGATITVIVESDDNSEFTSPVTRATFTAVTLAGGATSQWIEVAGPITDTYYRVSYTVAGTLPSINGIAFVGIQ